MSAANRKLCFGLGLGLTSLPLLSGVASGAEWRVEPQVEAGVQSNSNIALSPDASDEDSVEGFSGEVGLLAEVITPRSTSTIKPTLKYQSYLDRSDLDRLESFLEFKSKVRNLRSTFDLAGDFSRQNELTAELPDAAFNQVNPDLPTTPETGDVRIGETRDLYTLRPEYSYLLTERLSLGGAVLYQMVDYSGDDEDVGSADYTYTTGTLFTKVGLGPRTDLTVGGFVGRYEASDIDSESDSVGATLKLAQRWSDRLQVGITASYQQIDITQRTLIGADAFTATAAARRRCNPFLPPFFCPPERDPMPRPPRPDPTPAPPQPAPMTPPDVTPMAPPPMTPAPTPMTPAPTPEPPKAAPLPPLTPDPFGPPSSLQTRAIEETNNAYGLEFNAEYLGTVSRVALSAGRQVTPTGSGGLSNLDQIRLQYDRDFSERLSFTTAARAFRNRAVAEFSTIGNNDRDFARGSVSLTYMVTATWYVSAGYDYTWQDRQSDSGSASNSSISLAFGYRGLAR